MRLNGNFFVSLLVDDQTVKLLPKSKIELDAGIASLITSNGEKVSNPKPFNCEYRRLKAAQKTLSRRVKDSNYRKAALEIARVHASIRDARTDFLHQLTTRLVHENQLPWTVTDQRSL